MCYVGTRHLDMYSVWMCFSLVPSVSPAKPRPPLLAPQLPIGRNIGECRALVSTKSPLSLIFW
jgi:hypothetical protein